MSGILHALLHRKTPVSLSEKVISSWVVNRNRPLWGVKINPYNYQWTTYDSIFVAAQEAGKKLREAGLVPGDVVTLCLPSSASWVVADLACAMYGLVSLPLDPLAGRQAMEGVWGLGRPKGAVCELGGEPRGILDEVMGKDLIVVLGDSEISPKNDSASFFHHIFPGNSEFNPDGILHFSEAEDKELAFTLQPTSGSTGRPKLLLRSRWNWCQREGGEDTTMLLGSLASPAPRSWIWLNIFSGGKTAQSSVESLVEDCQTVHPTQVSAPPLVWDIICEKLNSGRLTPTADSDGNINWAKNLFGPRCRAVTNTGAALSPATLRAMKVFFPGIAHDGYGSSETGGISVDGNLLPGVEIKLKDVPELGYFSTDTPFPRGELVVRTTTMFDGYFSGSLSETPKVSEDGWLETGDIVRIIGDRRIEVIDRKSSCVKLTNGKFVSLTGVEHVLGESELIGQVYVHVDPGDSSLIAVIVPELKNFRKFLTKKLGDSGKWENSELPEICGSEDASVEFLKEIRSLQKRFSSSPHELIRRVILEPEAFSVSNGLLNPSMKLCRPALSKKYSPMINQGIFPEIFSEGTSHSEKISKLIENVIGVPVGFNQKWTDIGIDSIASAQLAQKLSAHFGIMISVSSIFRSETPAGLLTRIASAQGGGPKKSDFAEETELLKKDISANLPSLHQHENERTNGITTVLLTGATGFFGAHLLQKLTDVPNVHVICLVRGDLQRLKDRMKFYGVTPNFEKVRVVSGDIALPNLGLSPEIFHSLRNSFDVLLHCAAKVNWLLPYSSLRAANTLPLFSLLSLTGTRPFHFISTIAVAAPGSCETRTGEPNVEYGYGASKWAAEALLERAGREKGARVYVYRPGHLVPVREGETKRGGAMGGMNEDDFLALLIRGCMEAGGFPSLEHEPQAEWTSVQTAASLVIASLMAREARDKKNLPTEFNLFTDSPTPYRTLFNFMNEKENFRLKEFGIPEWSEKVSDEKSPLHVLSHLVGHGLGGAGFGRSHANTNINYVLGGRPNWPKITRGSMEGWMSCVREREEGQGKVDKE